MEALALVLFAAGMEAAGFKPLGFYMPRTRTMFQSPTRGYESRFVLAFGKPL